MEKILVTGGNGFVGKALCKTLLKSGYALTAPLRGENRPNLDQRINPVIVGSIDGKTNWSGVINDIDIIIHLAARTHVVNEKDADALHLYRQINVEGTKKLALEAAKAGIKRFVYLSSVKVNGEGKDNPYTEADLPHPQDSYSITKLEGEKQLRRIAKQSGMEVVVIRPPLVYGPGVKANFLKLFQVVDHKVPLPLANVKNLRSFIYRDNLVDIIITSMLHPDAAGQTYLVSDDRDLSTPELIQMIAFALNKPTRLYPFPQRLLHLAGNLLRKVDAVHRLLGSLTVDIAKIKKDLKWTPPFSVEFGLRQTAKWFIENRKN